MTAPAPDTDVRAERALWAAVLEEAVRNACGQGADLTPADMDDATAFLRSRTRLTPYCEALGLSVSWVQGQLRQRYPWIFTDAPPPPGPWEAIPWLTL
jgi:hypothetical protein